MGTEKSWSTREGQFVPMPICWLKDRLEAGIITNADAVLELLMLHRFDGPGDALYASYPAEYIAEELGFKSTETVKGAIKCLRSKGFIRNVKNGVKGTTSVYELMPSHPWTKGGVGDHPSAAKGGVGDPKGWRGRPQRVAPDTTPIRTINKYKEADGVRADEAAHPSADSPELHVNQLLEIGNRTSATPEELRAWGVI